MKGFLGIILLLFLLMTFGGFIFLALGLALYIIEALLPIAIVVVVIVIIIRAIQGKSLNIFSSKDKRHRYRRRK